VQFVNHLRSQKEVIDYITGIQRKVTIIANHHLSMQRKHWETTAEKMLGLGTPQNW
jgi:hypothetical protein